MKSLVLLILLIPLGYSIEATIICPDNVIFQQEFQCNINVNDISDTYDLKTYIKGEGTGINRIWDGTDWQRADWYLKEEVPSNGDYKIRLIIHKEFEGVGIGELKLRKTGTSNIAFEQPFEIQVKKTDSSTTTNNDDETKSIPDNVIEKVTTISNKVYIPKNEDKDKEETNKNHITNKVIYPAPKTIPKKVINLNPQDHFKESQITVYTSKNERIMNYFVYGFILFLISVIGILLYEKQW